MSRCVQRTQTEKEVFDMTGNTNEIIEGARRVESVSGTAKQVTYGEEPRPHPLHVNQRNAMDTDTKKSQYEELESSSGGEGLTRSMVEVRQAVSPKRCLCQSTWRGRSETAEFVVGVHAQLWRQSLTEGCTEHVVRSQGFSEDCLERIARSMRHDAHGASSETWWPVRWWNCQERGDTDI